MMFVKFEQTPLYYYLLQLIVGLNNDNQKYISTTHLHILKHSVIIVNYDVMNVLTKRQSYTIHMHHVYIHMTFYATHRPFWHIWLFKKYHFETLKPLQFSCDVFYSRWIYSIIVTVSVKTLHVSVFYIGSHK